ncbi:MAG: sulfite exporter TauE/SafE family protein [Balneolaceae bacterium]
MSSEILSRNKLTVYWSVALLILSLWIVAMYRLQWWEMFNETWPLSLTMIFGSFIAGATAEGGGAVAFPVFTKMFGIDPGEAKIFSFMIQSFGMTMAGLVIYLRGIRVLWNVIGTALSSGIAGLAVGELYMTLPDPYPKLVFTMTAGVFGAFLVFNRWWINLEPRESLRMTRLNVSIPIILTGFIGGLISSVVGVGLDMMIFIILTLLYGINEKVSTPTTVVLMGLLSVAGFIWHLQISGEITTEIWRYWMSCVPVVIFGAPLGAWACDKIKRDHLIWLLVFLISIELITTVWLIPLNWTQGMILLITLVASATIYMLMLKGRKPFLD